MQSLYIQRDALFELRGFLESFRSELVSQLNGYRNRIQNLRESGISTEVAHNYESSYYTVNEGYLKQLVHNITEDDLPYINRQIEAIQNLIDTARK